MNTPGQRDPFKEIRRQEKIIEEMRQRDKRISDAQRRRMDEWRKERERFQAWQRKQLNEQPLQQQPTEAVGPGMPPPRPSFLSRLLRFIVILVGIVIALGVLFVFAVVLSQLLS